MYFNKTVAYRKISNTIRTPNFHRRTVEKSYV